MEKEHMGVRNWKTNTTYIAGLAVAGILFVSVLLGTLSFAAAESGSQAANGGWQTVITDTFESGISAGWVITDMTGATDGEYYWATTTYTASEGTSSVWATGGGIDGSLLVPGTDNYPNSAFTSMIHESVDLTGTTNARLSFDYWTKTDSAQDVLQVRVSTDGTSFTTLDTLTGDSAGWQSKVLDLSSYAGQTQLWVGFFFSSNALGTDRGVFVDNIALQTLTLFDTYLPVIAKMPTPTPTSTPTPPPFYYFDDFSDPESGWPVVDNTWNDQDCFKWYYNQDQYKVNICDDRTDVKVSPMVELPAGDYQIDVDARFRLSWGWWSALGILFDAKDDPDPSKSDLGDYYMLWVLQENSDQALPRYKWKILKDIPGAQIDLTTWRDIPNSVYDYDNNGQNFNSWRIVRTATHISIYVNDQLLGNVAEPRPTTNYQVLFGVYASTYETGTRDTPFGAAFDNYKVTELGTGLTVAQPANVAPYVISGDFGLEAMLPERSDN